MATKKLRLSNTQIMDMAANVLSEGDIDDWMYLLSTVSKDLCPHCFIQLAAEWQQTLAVAILANVGRMEDRGMIHADDAPADEPGYVSLFNLNKVH
jgi:hypothetical protein